MCACLRASGREHCFLRVFVFIHETVILLDVHLIEHFQLVFCDLSIVMETSYCEEIYNANTSTKECTWISHHRIIHGRRQRIDVVDIFYTGSDEWNTERQILND